MFPKALFFVASAKRNECALETVLQVKQIELVVKVYFFGGKQDETGQKFYKNENIKI